MVKSLESMYRRWYLASCLETISALHVKPGIDGFGEKYHSVSCVLFCLCLYKVLVPPLFMERLFLIFGVRFHFNKVFLPRRL